MNKILSIALLLLLPLLASAQVADVLLTWDPSPDEVDAYELAWGPASALTNAVVVASDGTRTTNSINLGTYSSHFLITNSVFGKVKAITTNAPAFFSVRAVKGSLKSKWSNEVKHTPVALRSRPRPPGGLKISKIPVYELQVSFSDDLLKWETNKTVRLVINSDRPRQFVRVNAEMKTMDEIRVE